ncbi:MAG: hypothetical protein P1U39_08995 [Legionellaceae bacterium]|nr:hypothetical protein [Legionellaceae bacterium]
MSFANHKEITVKVKGHERCYNVYEEDGRIFYFYTKSSPRRNVELTTNSLTWQQKAWVKSQDNSPPKFKVLAAIAKKIEQDIKIKDEELTQKIAENFKKPTIQQLASAAIVMQKLVRRRQAKKVVQAKREAAATKPDEPTSPSDPDDFSVESSISEKSKGSLKELSARPRGSRVLRGDEATLSSDSSDSTNRSEGSFVGSRSENSSSTKSKSERPVEFPDINSMEAESGSTVSSSRQRDLYDDDSSFDLWSGGGKDSGSDMGDNVSELGMDEVDFAQPRPLSTPPTSPAASNKDINDLTYLYRDLQAIVDILAHLKGNEPQLAKVREALSTAIGQTGGQVRPRSQATVEPPNAGVAGAETSPAPKVDDIEENIRLLEEVQGKLKSLLDNYRKQMKPELRDALVQLQDVVKNSITEANKIKKTRNFREQADSGRSKPAIPLSGMNTDTPKPTGQEDDDMNHDSSSTLTKN